MVIFGPKDIMTTHLFRLKATMQGSAVWQCPEVCTVEKDGLLIWMLEYEYWKWYDNYDDIRDFERIWSESYEADKTLGIQGYRWRFGEDDNDTEGDAFGAVADSPDDFQIIVERHVDHKFRGVNNGS